MKAKILLFDIETAPNLADVWRLFKTNVAPNQVRRNGRIIMWAGKWLHDKEVFSFNEHDDGREMMLQKLHEMMNEADITIGQNGDNFDIRWANWEFLRQGWHPPSPSKSIDTLKVLRQRFNLPSYRLDYVCKELGLGRKVKHTGHDLWVAWEAGDELAKKRMVKYCKQDVRLLQRLYYKIRPWIKSHPNLGLYTDNGRPTCPNCGSIKVIKRGRGYTAAGIYQRYNCNDCGTPLRGRVMEKDTLAQRRNALTQEK